MNIQKNTFNNQTWPFFYIITVDENDHPLKVKSILFKIVELVDARM
jgi:hypothetical protein